MTEAQAQAQAFVGQRVVMYNTGITRAQWMGGIVKGVGHDDKQAYHINVVHEDGFERRYEVSDMSAATPDQLGKDSILDLREEDVLYNRSDPEKLTGDALQQVRPSLCHCPSKTGPVCSACCAP